MHQRITIHVQHAHSYTVHPTSYSNYRSLVLAQQLVTHQTACAEEHLPARNIPCNRELQLTTSGLNPLQGISQKRCMASSIFIFLQYPLIKMLKLKISGAIFLLDIESKTFLASSTRPCKQYPSINEL
ncbi:hypothetical protein Pfo_015458 [Paulownia fortunei]|nr:hypothetical protein Pfo_015458 [Paulownia fortunei]